MTERVAQFGSSGTLAGIVTHPPTNAETASGVLLLNAGLLHRVGPNRVYVKLARRLARQGFAVLRFDFSGVGDSPSRTDDVSFDRYAREEVRAGMDLLAGTCGTRQFTLVGLCSGADAAYQTAFDDARVGRVVMINGLGLRRDAAQAIAGRVRQRTASRYYASKLWNAHNWKRVLTGRTDVRRALARVFGRPQLPDTHSTSVAPGHFAALAERGVDCHLILSEGSEALDAYRVAFNGTDSPASLQVVDGADHVFTPLWSQKALIDRIAALLAKPSPRA